jgi:hypothetical protein
LHRRPCASSKYWINLVWACLALLSACATSAPFPGSSVGSAGHDIHWVGEDLLSVEILDSAFAGPDGDVRDYALFRAADRSGNSHRCYFAFLGAGDITGVDFSVAEPVSRVEIPAVTVGERMIFRAFQQPPPGCGPDRCLEVRHVIAEFSARFPRLPNETDEDLAWPCFRAPEGMPGVHGEKR